MLVKVLSKSITHTFVNPRLTIGSRPGVATGNCQHPFGTRQVAHRRTVGFASQPYSWFALLRMMTKQALWLITATLRPTRCSHTRIPGWIRNWNAERQTQEKRSCCQAKPVRLHIELYVTKRPCQTCPLSKSRDFFLPRRVIRRYNWPSSQAGNKYAPYCRRSRVTSKKGNSHASTSGQLQLGLPVTEGLR